MQILWSANMNHVQFRFANHEVQWMFLSHQVHQSLYFLDWFLQSCNIAFLLHCHLVGSNSGKVCESRSPLGRLEWEDTCSMLLVATDLVSHLRIHCIGVDIALVTWTMVVAVVVDGWEDGGGVTLVQRSSRSLLYVLASLLTYTLLLAAMSLLLYPSNTRTSQFEPLALVELTGCCWSAGSWLPPAAACWPSCCCCCLMLFCFRCCSLVCCFTAPPCWSLCLFITWKHVDLAF